MVYIKTDKRNTNEIVICKLIHAYCEPLLMPCVYFSFNHIDLDRSWNSVFWKIFKTYDKFALLLRQLPITMYTDARKLKCIGLYSMHLEELRIGRSRSNIWLLLINQIAI